MIFFFRMFCMIVQRGRDECYNSRYSEKQKYNSIMKDKWALTCDSLLCVQLLSQNYT